MNTLEMEDGTVLNSKKTIYLEILKHFKDKFSKKLDVSQNEIEAKIDSFCNKFNVSLPNISDADKARISQRIDPHLISIAIKELNPSSAGGTDNIQAKLIKHMFSLIPNIITKAILREMNDETSNNTYTKRARQRKIVLIKKKSDKKGFKQLRPISLLTSFYIIM